jgi:hypothetical protein
VEEDGSLVKSGPDAALIFLVLRLLKRLQRMASVPAIVYDEYSRALEPDQANPDERQG